MINKQVIIASATKQESTKSHTDRFVFELKSAYCINCFLTPLGTNSKEPDANNSTNPTNVHKTRAISDIIDKNLRTVLVKISIIKPPFLYI